MGSLVLWYAQQVPRYFHWPVPDGPLTISPNIGAGSLIDSYQRDTSPEVVAAVQASTEVQVEPGLPRRTYSCCKVRYSLLDYKSQSNNSRVAQTFACHQFISKFVEKVKE